MENNTTIQHEEGDVESIYKQFGDVEASLINLHDSADPICSELGGCHLGSH
ncbi:hypothetical protein ACX43S_20020 [Enterobacter cloacae]